MPIPVQVEPLPARELAAPLSTGQPHAALQVQAEGGACTFAQLDADGRANVLDASLAGWLVAAGYPTAVSLTPAPPCDGLPPVQSVSVPSSGWLLGLRTPARAVDAAGTLSVFPIGDDARWWLVVGTGAAQLAVSHDTAPPTRFALTFADERPANSVEVPLGGAVVLPDAGTDATLPPNTVATVRVEGRAVVASGLAPGTVVGAVRNGDQPPAPFQLHVGAPLLPSARDVLVPAGGTKRVLLDQEPAAVWTADERIATVKVSGLRLALTGHAPGRTHVVIRTGEEVFLVPVAVGR